MPGDARERQRKVASSVPGLRRIGSVRKTDLMVPVQIRSEAADVEICEQAGS